MDAAKQQIVDRLKQATNVLVTVSANPSVDQLSAAIGFTLLLNKLGKHATAVFSGQVPSTIEFLQPEKTIEKTTDSLRDFIIALDKNKADKLRYKVEDQMVKIFITPYRTSITDKDLEYSQGDFNVEVVVTIGVTDPKDLDQAIITHGRILHDATVISANIQPGANLGAINWSQPTASSLSEMMVNLGVELKQDILDGQMSTAFLTGIVAETDRFSNEKTSSETMQTSAKLMTAGANQQLVASKLKAPEPEPVVEPEVPKPEEQADLPEPNPEPKEKPAEPVEKPEEPKDESKPGPDGSLEIDHGEPKPIEEATSEIAVDTEPEEAELDQIVIDEHGRLGKAIDPPKEEAKPADNSSHLVLEPPTLGGTLTASGHSDHTEPSVDALGVKDTSSPLLSHDTPPALAPNPPSPTIQPPVTPPVPSNASGGDSLVDLEKAVASPHIGSVSPAPAADPAPASSAVPSPLDVLAARDAVHVATKEDPKIEPLAAPTDLGAMPAVSTSPESAFMAPASPEVDPALPPSVVPADPGLPADNTATSTDSPTAPPPVPPPMMPPVMPPATPPSEGA